MNPTETAVPVDQAMLVKRLRQVGLAAGDVVLVHSSLSAFGRVDGGAATVIDALLEAVGPAGTVVVPTFTWGRNHAAPTVVFDVANDEVKSEVGIIPETFRRRPRARRGVHLCHSFAAIGPHAESVMGDGVKSFGKGSTFDRLEDLNAWNLLLGVGMSRCTALHHVEDLMRVPYREYRDYRGSTVILPDGRHIPSEAVEFLRKPGFQNDFAKMDEVLAAAGILRTTRIGRAVVTNARIRDIVRVACDLLAGDINYLLVAQQRGPGTP